MHDHFREFVLQRTHSNSLHKLEEIQSLWSGYGAIDRYELCGGELKQIVVKHVKLPNQANHPRGWNTNLSHQRKVKSYQVESTWYESFSQQCDEQCRVPVCYGAEAKGDEFLMVLEDLNSSGFAVRKTTVSLDDMKTCLAWLANFHSTFMGVSPRQLWQEGTYWHLATRPDELEALEDTALKDKALEIDQVLRECEYQTLVHGDAKLANFCFSEHGDQVAAVDFQYVGGGCGMKDVAYFIGSCLYEEDCEAYEQVLLDAYFAALANALNKKQPGIDAASVEKVWRPLYEFAWTDFHRFVKGWSPGHWKIHGYSERIARRVVASL